MPRQTTTCPEVVPRAVMRFNEGRGRCPAKLGIGVILGTICSGASMKGGADAPPNESLRAPRHPSFARFNEGRGRCPAKQGGRRGATKSHHDASMKGGADAPPNLHAMQYP